MPAPHNNFDQYCKDIIVARGEVFNAILAALMPGLSLEQIRQLKRQQRSAKAEFRAIAKIMRAEICLRVDAMRDGRRYSALPGRSCRREIPA